MPQEQYRGMRDIFKRAFYLLKLLARENEQVQTHIFDRLDILLDVRVVESDLAVALKEVRVAVIILADNADYNIGLTELILDL